MFEINPCHVTLGGAWLILSPDICQTNYTADGQSQYTKYIAFLWYIITRYLRWSFPDLNSWVGRFTHHKDDSLPIWPLPVNFCTSWVGSSNGKSFWCAVLIQPPVWAVPIHFWVRLCFWKPLSIQVVVTSSPMGRHSLDRTSVPCEWKWCAY